MQRIYGFACGKSEDPLVYMVTPVLKLRQNQILPEKGGWLQTGNGALNDL
jgi:hypothetical protein